MAHSQPSSTTSSTSTSKTVTYDLSKFTNPNGRLSHLTPSQHQTLSTFKDSIIACTTASPPSSAVPSALAFACYDPIRHTDALLLKFLRARKFNLTDALDMFYRCERWRIDVQANALISFRLPQSVADSLNSLYPRYYHKCDAWGHPVYYESFNKFNYERLLSVVNEGDLFLNHIASYEYMTRVRFPACSAAVGRPVEECFIVLDVQGAPLMQLSKILSFVKRISEISQNYYPECMFKMIIINAPMLFTGAFSLVKSFIDPVTKEKIQVVGTSYRKYLFEWIPADNVPKYYGGNCCCPAGCMNSDEGPWKASYFALKSESGNEGGNVSELKSEGGNQKELKSELKSQLKSEGGNETNVNCNVNCNLNCNQNQCEK